MKNIIAFSIFSALAHGYMSMVTPAPFKSPYDPLNSDKDWNMGRHLEPDGSNYPCFNYHKNNPERHVVAQYSPGETVTASFTGNAPHRGGSCQFSLSYDEGTTWYVVKSIIGGCMCPDGIECPNVQDGQAPTEQFTIPSDAPAGSNILLGWSWMEVEGAPHFHMNCAAIDILGSNTSGLGGRPEMYLANIFGQSCTKASGTTVVYPYPGPDVEYGGPYATTAPTGPTLLQGCPAQQASLPAVNGGSSPAPSSSSTRSSSSSTRATTSSTRSSSSSTRTTSSSTRTTSSTRATTSSTRVSSSSTRTTSSTRASSSSTRSSSSAVPTAPSCSFSSCSGTDKRNACINGQTKRENAPQGFVCSQGIWTKEGDVSGTCTHGTKCAGSSSYYQCSNGYWLDFGAVPNGFVCSNDKIIPA